MSDYFIMRGKEEAAQDVPASLPLSECTAGRLHTLRLPDGRKAILIRRGERLLAYLAVCPHMGGDMALGSYGEKECRISCRWHGYRFDAESGKLCENPNISAMKLLRTASPHFDPDRQAQYRLQPLQVRIDGGQVSVAYRNAP